MKAEPQREPARSVERQAVKIPDRVFFKIGDVAELAGVKPYVLRYWESEFPMISPQKALNGQRVYRRTDVETVLMIKTLLYEERYSIEGARRRIRELRREGELKTFRRSVAAPEPQELIGVEIKAGLKRAKQLAREMKQLSQTPINKLFAM